MQTKSLLHICRSLLDEAWLGRGDGEVGAGSIGDTSAGDFTYPASIEDIQLTSAWDTPAAARELSEPDAMDFLDKMGTVYSNAQVSIAACMRGVQVLVWVGAWPQGTAAVCASSLSICRPFPQDLQSLSGVSLDLDGIKFEPEQIKGNSVKFVAGKVGDMPGAAPREMPFTTPHQVICSTCATWIYPTVPVALFTVAACGEGGWPPDVNF